MTGLIDLSQARPLDRLWYLKLAWVFDHLENELIKENVKLYHELHCGALEYASGQKVFDVHWEQALEIQKNYKKLLFPWLKGDDRESLLQRMTAHWEEVFGKMDDEETSKKISHTVRAMYANAARGFTRN